MVYENEYKNTYEVLDNYGYEIAIGMKKLLEQYNKRATGMLINSIDYDIDTSDGFTLIIEYAQHGKFVKDGRRAGSRMPPVEAIKRWLKQKKVPIGAGKLRAIGGAANLKKPSEEKQLNNIAWAISKSIAKNGIKQFNFLKPYEENISSQKFTSDLITALVKDTEKIINE